MADFRNVPAEQKKEVGIKINELKQTALERINSLRDSLRLPKLRMTTSTLHAQLIR